MFIASRACCGVWCYLVFMVVHLGTCVRHIWPHSTTPPLLDSLYLSLSRMRWLKSEHVLYTIICAGALEGITRVLSEVWVCVWYAVFNKYARVWCSHFRGNYQRRMRARLGLIYTYIVIETVPDCVHAKTKRAHRQITLWIRITNVLCILWASPNLVSHHPSRENTNWVSVSPCRPNAFQYHPYTHMRVHLYALRNE